MRSSYIGECAAKCFT